MKVGDWRYYLKEKELSSVKVMLSIEWQCNSNVYGSNHENMLSYPMGTSVPKVQS